MAKTLQSGIKGDSYNTTGGQTFEKFGYFLEGIDVTSQGLDAFTPYIKGVSRIFMHKAPPFMSKAYANLTKTFKTYLETGYTSIDGISDVSVDFTDFEGGFAGQRFSSVQLARDDTESFTVSLYELTGSPIRNYIDLWVTGTRDIRSGIAHYHGQIAENATDENMGTRYRESNHTAEFIYDVLDPTGMDCEYVAMFAHAFPTKVPKSHLNYTQGDRDKAQLDLEFKCTKYESPAVNEVGKWYIRNSQIKYNYLDFDPHILDAKTGKISTDKGRTAYRDMVTYNYGSSSDGTPVTPSNERDPSNPPKFVAGT